MMNNDTKRDVFERALTEWYDLIFKVGGQGNEAYGYCEFDVTLSKYEKDYDAALPDNLPVIPKTVSEYIKRQKDDLLTEPLFAIFLTIQHNINTDSPPDLKAENWIIDHGDTFARAWLLGVWRVEEKGEIVKLEADR